MSKKIVTLYIDDLSLRVLVTRGKEVSKWVYAPLEPGMVETAVIMKEDEVAEKIKELFEAQDIGSKKIDVGISGLLCLTRAIELPQLPKGMIDEAVVREAKKIMPLAMENLYNISWQSMPGNKKNGTRAFMIAVRHKTIDALSRTLRKAGLEIRFLDIKPLALSRLVTEKTAIILDVQPNEFDIVIMVDGIPQPIRTFPFPPELRSWQERLRMVIEHADNTLKFYNSHNAADSPLPQTTPIFVSGELLSQSEAHQALSEELGHPVEVLASPLKHPDGFDLSQFTVNIGVALRELPQVKKTGLSVAKLSALPFAYQPKHFSLARVSVIPGIAIFALALAPLVMSIQGASASLEAMQNQLDMINQHIVKKQMEKRTLVKEIAGLKERIAEVETSEQALSAVLSSLDTQNQVVNGDVTVASDLLPAAIELSAITHTGDTMKINGVAPDEDEVLLYASSLRDTARFSEVVVTNITTNEDGWVEFTLVLKSRG